MLIPKDVESDDHELGIFIGDLTVQEYVQRRVDAVEVSIQLRKSYSLAVTVISFTTEPDFITEASTEYVLRSQ
jgi:hypothetical protein